MGKKIIYIYKYQNRHRYRNVEINKGAMLKEDKQEKSKEMKE